MNRPIMRRHSQTRVKRRDGFTLIEMLVVITIVVILATLTVAVIATSINTDRIRGAARQLQSTKQGAMNRAIQAEKPVGVRLLVNADDPTTVSSLIFVEQVDPWTQGTISLGYIDHEDNGPGMPRGDGMADDPPSSDGNIRAIRGKDTGWWQLKQQGLLPPVTRIKWPAEDGNWYLVDTSWVTADDELLYLNSILPLSNVDSITGTAGVLPPMTIAHGGATGTGTPFVNADHDKYILELGNAPLPNVEPLQLPNGSVVDLDYSLLPRDWRRTIAAAATVPTGWVFVGNDSMGDQIIQKLEMDLMFSPKGVIAGTLAASGKIHLVLADIEDTEQNRPPEASFAENLIVSIYTNTGNVAVYPVDKVSPLGANGVPGAAGDDDGNLIVDFDGDGVADPLELGLDDDNLLLRFNFAETGEVAGQ